jgi:hypothetical protein
LFVIFIALKNEHKTEKEQKQSFSQWNGFCDTLEDTKANFLPIFIHKLFKFHNILHILHTVMITLLEITYYSIKFLMLKFIFFANIFCIFMYFV